MSRKKKESGKLAAGLPVASAVQETGTTYDKSEKRGYVIAPLVVDSGLCCPHCGECFGHRVTNTYPNQNRRHICGSCGKPFVAMRKTAQK